MAMYIGSDKISGIDNIISDDSYRKTLYLRNELVDGGNIDGISHLRAFAYYNQKNLEIIELPESLETMGSRAFSGCESLKQVTCAALTPPLITFSYDDYYFGKNIDVIYIPIGTLESYSSANYWSKYADKFVEKEDL